MDGACSNGVSHGNGESGDSDSVGDDTDDGSVLAITMTIIKRFEFLNINTLALFTKA